MSGFDLRSPALMMSDENIEELDERDSITLVERKGVWASAILLLLVFAISTAVIAGVVYKCNHPSKHSH